MSYDITAMGNSNGLNSSDVSALYQDIEGFIWVGTQTGVSRFNGQEFKNFTKAQKVSLGRIHSIVEDNNRKLWIAGANGLFFYKNGEYYKTTLNTNDIQVLHFENNRLWVGGHGFVPFSLTPGDLKKLKNSEDIEINPIVTESVWKEKIGRLLVRDIDIDDENKVWLAVYNKRISFEGNELKLHWEGDASIKHDYNVVKALGNGSTFWGSEDSGLIFQENNEFKELTNSATYIFASTESSTYFLTTQELLEFKDGEFKTLHTFSAYANLYFKKMIVDREGNFWIGAEGNLLKLTQNYSRRWSFSDEPLLQSLYSISQLSNGEILIGSSKQKILTLKADKIVSITNLKVPHNSQTYAIYNDKNDWIWYGTSMGGLVVDRNGKKEIYSEQEGLGDKGQYFFYNSSDDVLWSGGENGIIKINIDINKKISFNNFMLDSDAIETPIFKSIFESPDKSIWAASDKGLFVIKDNELKRWLFPPSITPSPVFTNSVIDDEGQLWLSTQGEGLWQCKFNDENEPTLIHQWTINDGLSTNVILDILIDKTNRFWVAGQNDLCCLEFKLDKPTIRCFDKIDGWLKEPTPHCRLLESDDGYLWSVGLTEISAIPLYNLPINKEVPNTFISKVELFNGNEDIYTYSQSSQNKNLLPEYLELPFNKNFIGFYFGSTSFTKSEKNNFSYKLIGLDPAWSKLSPSKEVHYSGLQPGDYTFKVIATNNDNVYSIKSADFSFAILAPWYKSWAAYFIYLLLITSLIYLFYRFQLSKKLTQAESLKLKELNQLKNSLYTNITHEFRTPLTVILGMADTLKANFKEKQFNDVEKSLEMIHRNGESLLLLVNEMLDLAKSESGNMGLNLVQADVVPFIKYLSESFNSLARKKQINLTVYSEIETLIMDIDANKVASIISNLLTNAIKFTHKFGKIIVHINCQKIKNKTYLFIKIRDNGIGISKADISNVFNRFYQIDDTSSQKSEGTGIGLALTKELVELMNGTITVKSKLSKGSEFILLFPVNRNSPTVKEIETNIDSHHFVPNSIPIEFEEHLEINSGLPFVLIIEDNIDVAQYLTTCLKGKYKTEHAQNGVIGLEMAFDKVPDIIISDVMMPGIDGLEVCATLKSDGRTDHIPIIMLTAKVTASDRLAGLSHGADAYLSKPFNKEELFTRLDQLVLLRKKLIGKIQKEGTELFLDKETKNPKIQFLQKVVELIHEEIGNSEFGTENLSEKLQLSDSQVYRKIKAITGKSTAVFIRSIRLQYAKELLKSTDKTISEVAYDSGFSSPSWFSRAFKEEFGYTPSTINK